MAKTQTAKIVPNESANVSVSHTEDPNAAPLPGGPAPDTEIVTDTPVADPRSRDHEALREAFAAVADLLPKVIGEDFKHIETDAINDVMRLWDRTRGALTGHGIVG